jgi:hypothetical protein
MYSGAGGEKPMGTTVRNILIAVVLLPIGFGSTSMAQSSKVVPSSINSKEVTVHIHRTVVSAESRCKASPREQFLNETINSEDESTQEGTYIIDKEYWRGYIFDTKRIIASPLGWERSDWLKVSFVVGVSVGLYAYDEDIRDWVQDNRNDTRDDIADIFEIFGDGQYTLPPLGVLYAYGHFTESERARRAALLSLESFLVSGVFTQAIKFAGHRHRPDSGQSSREWDGPGFSSDDLSFPSGHSQTAFSIATVIASEYDDYALISPLAYGIATMAAFSRVYHNNHWVSDVFFGSVLGYFTAKAIVAFHDSDRGKNLCVAPIVDGRQTGLFITYWF